MLSEEDSELQDTKGSDGIKPTEGEDETEELSPTAEVIKATRSLLNAIRHRDFKGFQ